MERVVVVVGPMFFSGSRVEELGGLILIFAGSSFFSYVLFSHLCQANPLHILTSAIQDLLGDFCKANITLS